MVAKPQLVTADELLEMPDDGHCYELVRGAFQKTAPSGSRDSIAAVHVVASLYNHAKSNNLGTVSGADGGFLLARDPDLVRVPDAAFVRREQVEEVGMVESRQVQQPGNSFRRRWRLLAGERPRLGTRPRRRLCWMGSGPARLTWPLRLSRSKTSMTRLWRRWTTG